MHSTRNTLEAYRATTTLIDLIDLLPMIASAHLHVRRSTAIARCCANCRGHKNKTLIRTCRPVGTYVRMLPVGPTGGGCGGVASGGRCSDNIMIAVHAWRVAYSPEWDMCELCVCVFFWVLRNSHFVDRFNKSASAFFMFGLFGKVHTFGGN